MSAGAATFRRIRLRRVRPRVSRQRVRLLVAVALVVAILLGGGWFLLRDSSLVSVEHVTVTGAAGSDAAGIALALNSAARKMTTLDVQTSRLRRAVAGFPDVTGLSVSTRFPHGIVIHVVQLLPIGAVEVDGRRVGVTADGRLLPTVAPPASLPLILLSQPPTGRQLTRAGALGATQLLGAAPYRLLSRCSSVSWQGAHGLVVVLRDGPSIYFGQASHLAAKWRAAVAVLADPRSVGASYVDVTDPGRPAAGAATAGSQSGGASSSAGGVTSSAPGQSPASSGSATPAGG